MTFDNGDCYSACIASVLEKPLKEIKKMVEGIPKSVTWIPQFEWEPNLIAALDKACMNKNIDRKNLVTKYIKQGLKNDGFL